MLCVDKKTFMGGLKRHLENENAESGFAKLFAV